MTAALIGSSLLSAAWKGSLVLAFVLILTRLLRNRIPARWAHLLLLVAIARLLMPLAPASGISVFNLAPAPPPADVVVVQDGHRGPDVPLAGTVSATPAEPRTPTPLVATLLSIWLAGALVMLARTARHTFAVRRIVRRARLLAEDSEVGLLLDESRAASGVRRRVALRVSAETPTPALHGLITPILVLPDDFERMLTREQLRLVFLHELAHLRRLDVLVNWVTTVAHALHWFNPLVWLAVTRLAEERELACDALALEPLADSERRAYGGTVLQLLDRWRLSAPAPGLVGMATTPQQMKRRIRMIAAFQNEKRQGLWMALVATLAIVSLTDASGGERRIIRMEPTSPEAKAVIEALEPKVSFSLTAVSIDDVLNTLSNKTGVAITVADGAIDDATRQARITIDARDVSAHVTLFETLSSLDLAVRFDEKGVQVVKLSEGHERMHVRHRMHAPAGEGAHEEKVFIRKHRSGEEKDVIVERHGTAERHIDGEKRVTRRKIEVEAKGEAGDGVTRRKVTVRGGEEGQAEGTLSLEVQRVTAPETR